MRRSEPFVRLKEKTIYLSSGAGQAMGSRIDLYEKGDVVALVRNERGAYHLSDKSENCKGKVLCSREISSYLKEKFNVDNGASLTAWIPPEGDGSTIFFSKNISQDAAQDGFDDAFCRIDLEYRKRFGEWVYVEDNCISFTKGLREALGARVGLHGDERVAALVNDPAGRYQLEIRKGRKQRAVYASELAAYLKGRFGNSARGTLLHARKAAFGILFADSEDALELPATYIPPALDLGGPKDLFVNVSINKGVYISARAAQLLGGSCSLYRSGDFLALAGEGELKISRGVYSNIVFSKALHDMLKTRYGDAGRLYLQPHGSLLVLMHTPSSGPDLPAPQTFCYIPIGRRGLSPARRMGDLQTVADHTGGIMV